MTRATRVAIAFLLAGLMSPPIRAFRSPYRIDIADAIECMVTVLGPPGPRVLLCSTVDETGFVGPGDCFSIENGLPSSDVLFHLARKLGASGVLCGSRATHSVFDPEECDYELTKALVKEAHELGLVLAEHALIEGNHVRLMRESLEGPGC